MNTIPTPQSAQAGQGLTEYITLLMLVSVLSIVAARSLGRTIQDKIQVVRNHIDTDLSLNAK